MRHAFASGALALALAACGSNSGPAEQAADQLDNAAAQSTPAAADVLENAAETIRDQGDEGAIGDPNASVQQAMNQAGAAQAGNTTTATPTPPARQAAPHGAEKGNPPPKTEPGQ